MAGRIIVSEGSKSRMPTYMSDSVSFAPSSRANGAVGSRRVDDSVLIRRAQQGDTTAFEELVRLYDRSVLRLAVHLTGSQEGLDHLRKKHSRGRDLTTAVSPDGGEEAVLDRMPDHRPAFSPERSLQGRELRESIVRALGQLSPRERMVFELKHYHGMRLRTVAGILNTTEGTIKNTLFRATHKLRGELAWAR